MYNRHINFRQCITWKCVNSYFKQNACGLQVLKYVSVAIEAVILVATAFLKMYPFVNSSGKGAEVASEKKIGLAGKIAQCEY